jgi:hypothetical protein
MYVLGRAFYVRGNYYLNQKPLLNYLFVHDNHVYGASISPDGEQYNEDILHECSDNREAVSKAKEAGLEFKTTIIL